MPIINDAAARAAAAAAARRAAEAAARKAAAAAEKKGAVQPLKLSARDEMSSGKSLALKKDFRTQLGATLPPAQVPATAPGERDGTAATAMGWASGQLANGNRGYDNYCLQFVQNAYNLHQDITRSPELYRGGTTGDAIGAYRALEENGKIVASAPTDPLPAGAMVFFEATPANGGNGHVALATGNLAADGTPEVISSGFPGTPGVHLTSVGQLASNSGPYLGHTTPELAWGAEAVSSTGPAGPVTAGPTAAQQWNNTCGANALMALEAAIDPARAAALAGLSGEDRKAFEAAVLNSDPTNRFELGARPGGTTIGWGSTMMGWQVSDRFGGEAEVVNPADRGGAVDAMTRMLSEGRPVAIGLPGHWMAATEMRDGAAGREILIADSWTGTTAWVPEAELRAQGSGWVRDHFPGAPFEGRIATLVAPGEATLAADSQYRANEPAISAPAEPEAAPLRRGRNIPL